MTLLSEEQCLNFAKNEKQFQLNLGQGVTYKMPPNTNKLCSNKLKRKLVGLKKNWDDAQPPILVTMTQVIRHNSVAKYVKLLNEINQSWSFSQEAQRVHSKKSAGLNERSKLGRRETR